MSIRETFNGWSKVIVGGLISICLAGISSYGAATYAIGKYAQVIEATAAKVHELENKVDAKFEVEAQSNLANVQMHGTDRERIVRLETQYASMEIILLQIHADLRLINSKIK